MHAIVCVRKNGLKGEVLKNANTEIGGEGHGAMRGGRVA